MQWVYVAPGVILVCGVLWDAFAAIVVPKMVERRLSIASVYYHFLWKLWNALTSRMREGRFKSSALMAFAPLSLIFLFAVWATMLILGFTMIEYGAQVLPEHTILDDFYFSGVTFFTLGYGDLTPSSSLGRFLAVLEAGTGFGFLALIISYFPTFYNAFSRREHFIVQMDSRAGSNPSGGELVKRYSEAGALSELSAFLREGERWSAEQLESYLSYPTLAYYRSQHDTQSWLTTMTALLDACSLILAGMDDGNDLKRSLRFQAASTFAMARHVIVDVAYVLGDPPDKRHLSRRSPLVDKALAAILQNANGVQKEGLTAKLDELSKLYEPYLIGLAIDLHFSLPSWVAEDSAVDNWRVTAWNVDGHFE